MTVKVTFGKQTEIDWRTRALLAEKELATVRPLLETATEQLAGIELRFADRAALVSMTREGRYNKFTFVRNGELIRIDTMGLLEDDWPEWHRQLLEK